jgi:FkbM family methyltransferase
MLRSTARSKDESAVFNLGSSSGGVARRRKFRCVHYLFVGLSLAMLYAFYVYDMSTIMSKTNLLQVNAAKTSSSLWDPAAAVVLIRQGRPLTVPEFNYSVPFSTGGFRLIPMSPTDTSIPRADGDEAMMFILEEILQIKNVCSMYSKYRHAGQGQQLVVDVGGLYGDFGMSAAAAGCPTVIYEPQRPFAERIARSALLNQLQDKVVVRNAAVSNEKQLVVSTGGSSGQVFFQTAQHETTADTTTNNDTTEIATERLDDLLKTHENLEIFFLKVDVEGFEDAVLDTASKLFAEKRIKHAVLEYTPHQFKGRGTDYTQFLSRLYDLGAVECFTLHRRLRRIYRITKGDEQLFYDEMVKNRLQSDIYCKFDDKAFDTTGLHILDWSPRVSLLK